jgi:hypothetical protein
VWTTSLRGGVIQKRRFAWKAVALGLAIAYRANEARRIMLHRRTEAEALPGLPLSTDQAELNSLPEVVPHRPVLDHLPVLEAPYVDVLGGELLAARGSAKKLTDVPAVHHYAGDDLVTLTDLVLDLGAHRAPEPAQPADGLLEALRALGLSGGASWFTNSGWMSASAAVATAVVILGGNGVAITAAGAILTATAAVGALCFAAWALVDRMRRQPVALATPLPG